MRLRDRRPRRARWHSDFAHGGQRIQIEHRDSGAGSSGPRDVQPPPVDVRVDVVETAGAADLDRLHHFVRTGARRLLRQRGQRQRRDSYGNPQAGLLHKWALQSPLETLSQNDRNTLQARSPRPPDRP
jgi:hypothetical protein